MSSYPTSERSDAACGADISPDGVYRYRLWRVWDADRPIVLYIMLNPSTADALTDDPTIRRCVGFARTWGFGGIEVVNLYGLRASNPKALISHPDPVGPANDERIIGTIRSRPFGVYTPSLVSPGAPPMPKFPIVVCAWGVPGARGRRDVIVCRKLNRAGVFTHRIGAPNADGTPRHPLYLPSASWPELFLHKDA